MRFATLLVVPAALVVACSGAPPPPPPLQVVFVVEGDPGKPLAGVEIQRRGATIATTDADGRARAELRGAEGEVTEASVVCPIGYASPQKPIAIRITHLTGGSRPEFSAQCTPLRRKVVVAVRADNGGRLPVTYLNKVVAMTDDTGAAHFTLDLEPGTFQVALDTSDRKDLKPESPRKTFTVQKDDILLFDQKFKVEKKLKPQVKTQGPICISCKSAG